MLAMLSKEPVRKYELKNEKRFVDHHRTLSQNSKCCIHCRIL